MPNDGLKQKNNEIGKFHYFSEITKKLSIRCFGGDFPCVRVLDNKLNLKTGKLKMPPDILFWQKNNENRL